MHTRPLRLYLVILLPLFFLMFTAQPAQATESTPDSGSGFTIQAVLPSNQIASTGGYFNLVVQPGETQQLTVKVINLTARNRKLRVIPTNAWTGDNGQVSYSPNKLRHPHAKPSFTQLSSPAVDVDLKPHEGKPVTFSVAIPPKGFSGQILGGIYVSDPKTTSGQNGANFRINNHYSMALAVNLQTKEQVTVKPELKLNRVIVKAHNHRAIISANIENSKPVLFGDLSLNAKIKSAKNKHIISSTSDSNYAVAPDTDFNYQMKLPEKKLKPGHYKLNLTAKSGVKTWHLTKDFTVSKQTANEINRQITIRYNWLWLYILLGFLAAALLVISGYLFAKHRLSRQPR